MRCFISLLSVVSMAAVLLSATAARADEEKIDLDKLPKAVVDAIKAKFPEGKMVSAEKETDGDKTVYEVVVKNKDKNIEIVLTPDGKIVEIEQEIPAKDLPKEVTQAIDKAYPKSTIKSVEEQTKGDKVNYGIALETDVTIDKEKQKVQLSIGADGKIAAAQKLIATKDLPKAVTDSLEKKYSKAKITRANEATKEDKTTYVVTLETADKKILAIVEPDGKVVKDYSEDKKDKEDKK